MDPSNPEIRSHGRLTPSDVVGQAFADIDVESLFDFDVVVAEKERSVVVVGNDRNRNRFRNWFGALQRREVVVETIHF